MLQPVWVLAIAAVLRPPRRLHIGGVPLFWPERAQGRRRVKRAGTHFHVVGLQDDATPIRPVALQRQDQTLERALRTHVGRQIIGARCVHGGTLLWNGPPRSSLRDRGISMAASAAPAMLPDQHVLLRLNRRKRWQSIDVW